MLPLGISTSSGQFALIIGEGGKALFDSSTVQYKDGDGLAERLTDGLNAVGRSVEEICRILVDVGPGGTSRVRTGIAFANALAYALRLPVCPVTSMELAGLDALKRRELPALHVVKSIKGNVYAGVADGSRCRRMEFGQLEDVVPGLIAGGDAFVVTGARRSEVLQLNPGAASLIDGGREYGDACLLVELESQYVARELRFPFCARPVTEQTL